MKFFDDLVLNMMCLLFPISIYIIFIAYFRNNDKRSKDIFLYIALYSSIYLLSKYGSNDILLYPMILGNIPLLIAYLKKKNKLAITLSIILICYYHFKINVDTANNWIKKWIEKDFLRRYDNKQIRNVDYVLTAKYYENLK